MLENNTLLYTILYTIGQVLLYSLILAVFLTILYYPAYGLFKLFNKKYNWNTSVLFSSYLFILVLIAIIYFIPSFFGIPLNGYASAESKILFVLYLIGQFLLYALIVTLLSQLFIFLGSYLISKFKFKIEFFSVIISLFIISLIIIILGVLFPWIPGGIITMIWF